MRTLYIECAMGASGDMLAGALLELLPEPEDFLRDMNALGIPGLRVTAEPAVRCGICGTKFRVTLWGEEEGVASQEETHSHVHAHEHRHEHEHSHARAHGQGHSHAHEHRGMPEIEAIIGGLAVPAAVRENALAVYREIAEAESRVHGVPVTEIHFHEVGAMDAIADILAVSWLLDRLDVGEITASPVHVGSGQLTCAHGILPVPAPATAYLLRGIPVYGGSIRGELCTPTGAALLRHFVGAFGDMPPMRLAATGYGMGSKDFPAANCLRAMLGERTEETGAVSLLECNLDDMTAEDVAFATEQLQAAGALEVYTTAVGMKKGRPGILLSVLCPEAAKEAVLRAMFRHTTTLGIRESGQRRYTLNRREETVQTTFGALRRKRAEGYGSHREKYEYEDFARLARACDLSLAELRARLAREEER